jgi:hypothetical protein
MNHHTTQPLSWCGFGSTVEPERIQIDFDGLSPCRGVGTQVISGKRKASRLFRQPTVLRNF